MQQSTPTLEFPDMSTKAQLAPRSGLLVIFISLLFFTGCLVHPNDSDKKKTYNRTTDNVHIYQAGDFIEYTVSGSISSGGAFPSFRGTMRINWYANPDIFDPVSTNSIKVLKEVTILTINGVETRTERYISQDTDATTNGTIKLHAFYKPASADLYWVSNLSVATALNEITVLKSPLMLNDSYASTFNVFDNCDATNQCDQLLGYQSDDIIKVELSDEIAESTAAGFFNTFRVTFAGNKTLTGSGITSFPINLDFRSSCGLGNTSYSGKANIFPEVGVIKMDVYCNSASTIYNYTIEFKRAGGSITLP